MPHQPFRTTCAAPICCTDWRTHRTAPHESFGVAALQSAVKSEHGHVAEIEVAKMRSVASGSVVYSSRRKCSKLEAVVFSTCNPSNPAVIEAGFAARGSYFASKSLARSAEKRVVMLMTREFHPRPRLFDAANSNFINVPVGFQKMPPELLRKSTRSNRRRAGRPMRKPCFSSCRWPPPVNCRRPSTRRRIVCRATEYRSTAR